MRLRLIMAAALPAGIVALCPTATRADQPWVASTTVEQAVARAIVRVMPDLRSTIRLSWDSVGGRGRADVFWHLHPPRPYLRRPLPEGVHRRTGWLQVDGRTGDVAVCGDEERVSSLTFTIGDLWLGEADVIEELTARDVRATLQRWRLERAGARMSNCAPCASAPRPARAAPRPAG